MMVYSSLSSAPCCMGYGQERSITQPSFTRDRMETMPSTSEETREEAFEEWQAAGEEKKGFPWWGYLGIGLGVVAVGGVLFAVFSKSKPRRRKKR